MHRTRVGRRGDLVGNRHHPLARRIRAGERPGLLQANRSTTLAAASPPGTMTMMVTDKIWPALDYSRVPYRLYHDAEVYQREQQRIFHGPVWNYLGLDAEIPDPGDFRATYVGETPVIFNRDDHGEVKAFVNRCAHRGALVRRELCGNARQHICIYHQWCYGLDGRLTAIPFRRRQRLCRVSGSPRWFPLPRNAASPIARFGPSPPARYAIVVAKEA